MIKHKFLKNDSMIQLIFMLLLFSINTTNAQSIAEFTANMDKKEGFFTFYYDHSKDRVYLQIRKFNQAFIFQSSLPHGLGSNDIGLDRGQLGQTRLVQFERYGNKVLLKQLNTNYRADSEDLAEKRSVQQAFASSVLAGFEIKWEGVQHSEHSEHSGVLIDYTHFLLSDIHGIERRLVEQQQGKFSIDNDLSAVYLPRSKAFERNTELEALITFKGKEPGKWLRDVSPNTSTFTVHLHHSLIQLPEEGYQPRLFHPFSGFIPLTYQDYAAPLSQQITKRYIIRHRLAKKNPNMAISTAVKPIIYYLDPGVPEPIRSALLEGASWWDQAFAALGYRDAFQVKILPADADPMDVRYNLIQWVHRATRGWSYGYSIVDPRNGEIIKGHVTLGSLRVRQDLLIAQGMTGASAMDPQAQMLATDMALDRIKQLAAHEVGHTLGIAHNFAASAKNRASVMDYPHPLFTLGPNDQVHLDNVYDLGIGDWDKFVINYGYGDFGENEDSSLVQLITKMQNAGYEFISDADARAVGGAHPRGHLWDNGQDAVTELYRVLALRQAALNNFNPAILADGVSIAQLQQRLVPVYLFHRYQVEAAVKLIAGEYYQYEVKGEQAVKGRQVVSASQQQKALRAVLSTLDSGFLTLPAELQAIMLPYAHGEYADRESFKTRTALTFDAVSIAEAAAGHSIQLLLAPQRLNRLAQQQFAQPQAALTVDHLLEQLFDQTIRVTFQPGLQGQIQRRLAHVSIELLMLIYHDQWLAPEVQAMIAKHLVKLEESLNDPKDATMQQIKRQINWFVKTGEWTTRFKLLTLPPGSPI